MMIIPFDHCFEAAQKYTGIEKEILYSIAKIESNFNHRAKNVNKNGTIDYGIMQVNSYWINVFSEKGFPQSYMKSPCGNIYSAAYILKYCMEKKKKFSLAIECYNKGEKVKRTGEYYKKFKKYYVYFKTVKNNYPLQNF